MTWSESELETEFLLDEQLPPTESTSIMGVMGRDMSDGWACDGSEAGLWEKAEAIEDVAYEGASSPERSLSSLRDGSATFFESLK